MHPQDTTPTKRCPKCGAIKPLDQFGKRRTSRDGLQLDCKLCLNAKARDRHALFRVPRGQADTRAIACRHCGEKVVGGGRGARTFCDRACYHAWNRQRIDAEMATLTAKTCTTCDQTKPLDAFYNDPKGKAGRSATCAGCRRVAARTYAETHHEQGRTARARYYAEHRDEGRAKAAQWRAENPERAREATRRAYWAKRDQYLAKNRANRVANRDRINADRAAKNRQNPFPARQRAQAWYRANLERAAQQRREYRRAHPDKHLESNRTRRARKLGTPVLTLDYVQWVLILDYFGRACAYCGATGVALTQDHIVPLSRGGEHSAANVVPACRQCNSRKFARPLWRFLLERGHEHGLHG